MKELPFIRYYHPRAFIVYVSLPLEFYSINLSKCMEPIARYNVVILCASAGYKVFCNQIGSLLIFRQMHI